MVKNFLLKGLMMSLIFPYCYVHGLSNEELDKKKDLEGVLNQFDKCINQSSISENIKYEFTSNGTIIKFSDSSNIWCMSYALEKDNFSSRDYILKSKKGDNLSKDFYALKLDVHGDLKVEFATIENSIISTVSSVGKERNCQKIDKQIIRKTNDSLEFVFWFAQCGFGYEDFDITSHVLLQYKFNNFYEFTLNSNKILEKDELKTQSNFLNSISISSLKE